MDAKNNPNDKKSNQPFVIFNTGILDPNQQENNSLYDPNFISSYYNNNNQQMQQQSSNFEMKNVTEEQLNYLNEFHNYYDYENNKFVGETPQEKKEKNEGEEILDPFGIREEMKIDDVLEKNGENKSVISKTQTDNNKQINNQNDKQFADIDYDKYIAKLYSNFQPQSNKKPRKNNNSNNNYDKEEINMSVNQYYSSFKNDNKNNDKSSHENNPKYEESKFEEPMSVAKDRKRKSKFEDNK